MTPRMQDPELAVEQLRSRVIEGGVSISICCAAPRARS